MKDISLLIERLQEDWGIEISDPEILRNAFRHSSYTNEQRLPKTANNERLEFLGDAALQLVITDYLFRTFPERQEGELSKLRSSIVRSESLADFSRRCHLDDYIVLGHGEEKTGGRAKNAILEDLFEAFLGALMLDQGYDVVKQFIDEVVIPTVETNSYNKVTDYKTALQELLQENGDTTIQYNLLDETGPAHQREFTAAVYENGHQLGIGVGSSKKIAEQEAAHAAILAAEKERD